MTLLGKSFTVIILILSLTFMVLALAVNASHRNWRDVVTAPGGLKDQIKEVEATNDQLRDSRQRTQAALDREQTSRRTALASLQTQLDALQKQLEDSLQKIQTAEADNSLLVQMDKSRSIQLEELTAETSRLRTQIRDEQKARDELFTKTLELTDSMNKLRGIVQIQKERNDQLMTQVTRYKEVVDAHGINMSDPLDGSPPDRNGIVLVIDRPKKLLEISIGYDAGLRSGHTLEVTRGGRYIAKARVVEIEPDRAVAEIMTDYSQGVIQEGDRVDTTLD